MTLSVREWRGELDSLDSYLLAAHLCDRQPMRRELKKTRVAMIAELAGPDPELAYRLSEIEFRVLFSPREFLRSFADERDLAQ